MSKNSEATTQATHMNGGPGKSQVNEKGPSPSHGQGSDTGQDKASTTRNPHHSTVSGGGGELDSHHTHDPS